MDAHPVKASSSIFSPVKFGNLEYSLVTLLELCCGILSKRSDVACGCDAETIDYAVRQMGNSCPRQRIPLSFLKHMSDETSGSVSLICPSGNTWEVNLMKNNESLFFNKGWFASAKDHFAELWDFFVFKYDDNSHFTVKVYDKTGCEKETAFLAKCSQGALKISQEEGKKRVLPEKSNDVVGTCGEASGVGLVEGARKMRQRERIEDGKDRRRGIGGGRGVDDGDGRV
ncbi:hypothetical protein RJ640_024697 [Escallonia rubra]|uniref:TF-B3 domain-containing protein n=1 Tax=Escallonia rubra TaxID=112253 RepID=A0AA88UH99_9ASTE|nr:hypothetical protein RJ640_024697 [Escallonia rubra]